MGRILRSLLPSAVNHRNVGATSYGRHTFSYSKVSTGRVPRDHVTTVVAQEIVVFHHGTHGAAGVFQYGPQSTVVGNERETVERHGRPLLQTKQLFDLRSAVTNGRVEQIGGRMTMYL